MSFPDMKSLMGRAQLRGFRQPHENESEEVYREAFADFMFNVDRVESVEIRTGKGWDALDPFTLLAGAMGGADKVHGLMADLGVQVKVPENKDAVKGKLPLPEYPHLMITSPRDGEMLHLYVEKEAEQMIELLAVFMATSPVVRTSEIAGTQITEIESMSAGASRYVVSRMCEYLEDGNEHPMLQKLVNSLAGRMLVGDLPLNISISKLQDSALDEGFALPA
jgi:hypothetical protein